MRFFYSIEMASNEIFVLFYKKKNINKISMFCVKTKLKAFETLFLCYLLE